MKKGELRKEPHAGWRRALAPKMPVLRGEADVFGAWSLGAGLNLKLDLLAIEQAVEIAVDAAPMEDGGPDCRRASRYGSVILDLSGG